MVGGRTRAALLTQTMTSNGGEVKPLSLRSSHPKLVVFAGQASLAPAADSFGMLFEPASRSRTEHLLAEKRLQEERPLRERGQWRSAAYVNIPGMTPLHAGANPNLSDGAIDPAATATLRSKSALVWFVLMCRPVLSLPPRFPTST
jgi:hypothetical protein